MYSDPLFLLDLWENTSEKEVIQSLDPYLTVFFKLFFYQP